MKYDLARHNMVESQIRPSDVTDLRIQKIMSTLPREHFVPGARKPLAYMDQDLEIGEGRYLLAPRTLARLIQACRITKEDAVLDLAPGTGYSSAVLAHLAAAVVGVESRKSLVDKAGECLSRLGIDNAAITSGALAEGCPGQAPFDVIFINGAIEFVPEALFAQLSPRGRIAAVVDDDTASRACVYWRHPADPAGEGGGASRQAVPFDRQEVFDAFAPKLAEFTRTEKFTFAFG